MFVPDITEEEVEEWMHKQWIIHAVKYVNDERLTLATNSVGYIKVKHNAIVHYLGKSIAHALLTYNNFK